MPVSYSVSKPRGDRREVGVDVYLETARLILRRFTAGDVDHLVALDGDPEVMRFLTGGAPAPAAVVRDQVLPRILAYYERGERYGYWAAVDKASGDFLGWFHFRPSAADPAAIELGYRLKRAAWGRGLATEGARALIDKGFTEYGLARVVATALAAHRASIRVMEKAGLRLVRRFVYRDGQGWHIGQEAVEYALTRPEWAAARAGRPPAAG
jgi:RimJ/RimL family protein N-acetyltransferase